MKAIETLEKKLKELLQKKANGHVIYWHSCDGETYEEAKQKYFATHEVKTYDLEPFIIKLCSDEEIQNEVQQRCRI